MVTSHASRLPFHAANSYFSSTDKTEKPGLLLHLSLSLFVCSYCGESGKELLFLPLNTEFVSLGLSRVMLH